MRRFLHWLRSPPTTAFWDGLGWALVGLFVGGIFAWITRPGAPLIGQPTMEELIEALDGTEAEKELAMQFFYRLAFGSIIGSALGAYLGTLTFHLRTIANRP